MSPTSFLSSAQAAQPPGHDKPSGGTPLLWGVTIGAVVALFVVDFLITRRPHEVSMKEARRLVLVLRRDPARLSVFGFRQQYGGDRGLEYYSGVVEGALGSLVHLGHGLAAILAFIGVKLVLHWGHGVWPAVPEVPTLPSLAGTVGILALVTTTSLLAKRRGDRRAAASATKDEDERRAETSAKQAYDERDPLEV